MGMGGGGGGGGVSSDINVTPLIDVLLVLIIVFMVIQPSAPKGLEALAPQPPPPNQPPPPPNPDDKTIVVQVLSTPSGVPVYKINQDQVQKQDLVGRLTQIFEIRSVNDKVMFVKGDKDLNYGTIAEVIAYGHQADVNNIGIITPQVEAGH